MSYRWNTPLLVIRNRMSYLPQGQGPSERDGRRVDHRAAGPPLRGRHWAASVAVLEGGTLETAAAKIGAWTEESMRLVCFCPATARTVRWWDCPRKAAPAAGAECVPRPTPPYCVARNMFLRVRAVAAPAVCFILSSVGWRCTLEIYRGPSAPCPCPRLVCRLATRCTLCVARYRVWHPL